MIDPRLFLQIAGPQSQPVKLIPGFHAPGPGPQAPLMAPPQMPNMGIPGMMMGRPNVGNPAGKAPGMPSPNQYGVLNPEDSMSAYPGDPNMMDPTKAGMGQAVAGGGSGGSFMNWLRGLF